MKPYTDIFFKQLTRTIIPLLKLNVNMLFILFLVSGTICMKKFFCFQLAFLIFTHLVCIFQTLVVYKIQMHVFTNPDTKTSYSYIFIRILFMVFSGKSYEFFSLPKMNGYLWQGSWIPPETMTVSNLPNISSLAARLLCSTFSLYTTGRSL